MSQTHRGGRACREHKGRFLVSGARFFMRNPISNLNIYACYLVFLRLHIFNSFHFASHHPTSTFKATAHCFAAPSVEDCMPHPAEWAL